MWEPAPTQGLVPVVADTTTLNYIAYEDPPHSAIFDAVEAPTPTDSITLSFPISKTNSLNYILMYFTEMTMLINETRAFDIYVDNVYVLDAIPEYENCSKGKSYAQPKGTLSVELRPKTVSTLPPIISAIEVYTASDALVTIGTSQDDCKYLYLFSLHVRIYLCAVLVMSVVKFWCSGWIGSDYADIS